MNKTSKVVLLSVGAVALLASILGISISLANRSGGPGSVNLGDSSSIQGSSSANDTTSSPDQSSGNGSLNATDSPYLRGDKTQIEMKMSNQETQFPEATFTVSIKNLPNDADPRAKKYLGINWCNQPEVLDYLFFYMINESGIEVACGTTGAQIIYSGETVHVRQKKKAPIYGGWTCQLLVHSPYYDSSLCEWPINVTLTTLA